MTADTRFPISQTVLDYTKSMARIDGWFWPAAAYLFAWIDEQQRRSGITGNLFEIGTYHGKSAALLARLQRTGERFGVCDLFGREVDRMQRPQRVVGKPATGFLAKFLHNLQRFGPSILDVNVFLGASGRLDVADTTDRCRLFHIDGGHEASDVYGDLEVADRALLPDGIVILDDFHNFAWPGVAEGFFQFMREHPGRFAPLAMGFNKGLLCRPNAHAAWRARLSDEANIWDYVPRGPFSLKTVSLCNWPTTIFYTPSYRSPDARRSVLATLYQMRPRLADWIARQLNYHTA